MSKLAPIVLFVYDRPGHTRQTLESLAANDLAPQSHLIIYADGPKDGAGREKLKAIEQTRSLLREKQWCGKVDIIESDVNKGLADNIVHGVTAIVNEYDRVIVLEDDLVQGKGFLTYMNQTLNLYADEEKVMHVAGYMYPVSKKLPDTFFLKAMFCWGWGTWKSSWKHFNGNAADLYQQLKDKGFPQDYNIHPANDFYEGLKANAEGRLKTWAIKWLTSIYLKEGLCLVPGRSLIRNIGHDGTGVHCGTNEQFVQQSIADYVKVERIAIEVSKPGTKAMYRYYDRQQYTLKNRILNKIETLTGVRL